ncbi:MAG: hypothetical protein RR177_03780 [Oscillospiraceae bacterium]
MKRIVILIITMLLLTTNVLASNEEIYNEQYEKSGAADLYESLPPSAQEFLNKIKAEDMQGASEDISANNVFYGIMDILKNGFKRPFASLCTIICLIILSSFLNGIASENSTATRAISYVTTLGVITATILPIVSVIKLSVSAIKGCSVFMLSFVPVFGGILISKGNAAVSAGFTGIMLAVSELISSAAGFLILPMVGIYLAFSICSAVSEGINITGIGELFKKTATWIMTFAMSIFLSVMSIQTIIGSSADSVAMKTAKFVVSSAVPVVGASIGEAISSVKACATVLSSSVGMFGVICVVACLLPVLIELFLWRISLLACKSVSDMFSLFQVSNILRAVDIAISFLIAIILCIFILFVVSTTMVTLLGGKV